MQKAWLKIPIRECGEALVPIPTAHFAFVDPPPYARLGAPYAGADPHQLRTGVLQRLLQVQAALAQSHPGWRLLIFDAYRPNAVQQFMVDHTYAQLLQAEGLERTTLSPERSEQLWREVYRFWSIPSEDPGRPPAHSTGAAIDIGLVDGEGRELDMGTPIDEFSPRAAPDHFALSEDPLEQRCHSRRQVLRRLMEQAGFAQHPAEWWHFSHGDQLWAWRCGADHARYGRADLV